MGSILFRAPRPIGTSVPDEMWLSRLIRGCPDLADATNAIYLYVFGLLEGPRRNKEDGVVGSQRMSSRGRVPTGSR